jgi:hypothetical protein
MSAEETSSGVPPWAAWSLVAGGVAAAGLWIAFTASHGPTSFNENRLILGRDMHFWGWLLGVVPNALVVAGLVGLRPVLLGGAGALARVGYVLALGGLSAAAAIDLVTGALGPPLLLPVQGLGLVLLGAGPSGRGSTRNRGDIRMVVLAIGALLVVAFGFALIPLDVVDAIGGYRIYGAIAHLATGVGWVVAGVICLQPASRSTTADAAP